MIKLVDVPEKNYYANKGKGEVCAKGHNIFKGYYKDPQKTAEAIDSEGWLHTGDVGMWLPVSGKNFLDLKRFRGQQCSHVSFWSDIFYFYCLQSCLGSKSRDRAASLLQQRRTNGGVWIRLGFKF